MLNVETILAVRPAVEVIGWLILGISVWMLLVEIVEHFRDEPLLSLGVQSERLPTAAESEACKPARAETVREARGQAHADAVSLCRTASKAA